MKTDPANIYGNLELSDYLCFAVYTTNLAFAKAYQQVLEPRGLTYTQYVTIIALSEAEDQTVGGLGAKLSLESNTLTPILKTLERSGLVTRKRDSQDERFVRLNLTDKGRQLRECRPESALAGILGLKPREFKQLQSALVKLRSNIVRSGRAQ